MYFTLTVAKPPSFLFNNFKKPQNTVWKSPTQAIIYKLDVFVKLYVSMEKA